MPYKEQTKKRMFPAMNSTWHQSPSDKKRLQGKGLGLSTELYREISDMRGNILSSLLPCPVSSSSDRNHYGPDFPLTVPPSSRLHDFGPTYSEHQGRKHQTSFRPVALESQARICCSSPQAEPGVNSSQGVGMPGWKIP